MKRIPFYRQKNDYYCGPACAKMMLEADGHAYTQKDLARLLGALPSRGTVRSAFAPVFRKHGYVAVAKIHSNLHEVKKLLKEKWRVMVNYREVDENIGHYAVITDIRGGKVIMNDPWHGASYSLPISEFLKRWHGKHLKANTRWIFAAKPKRS